MIISYDAYFDGTSGENMDLDTCLRVSLQAPCPLEDSKRVMDVLPRVTHEHAGFSS